MTEYSMRFVFDDADTAADALLSLVEEEYAEGVLLRGRYLYLQDEAEEDAVARILEYEDFDYEIEEWNGEAE